MFVIFTVLVDEQKTTNAFFLKTRIKGIGQRGSLDFIFEH